MKLPLRFWTSIFDSVCSCFIKTCLAVLAAVGASATAAVLEGEVIGLADGDTITVVDATRAQYKIRLAGIDAPEKSQAFGYRSQQNLAQLIYRKRVVIEWQKIDRYGRIIGKVRLDGRDVCLAQVSAGLAWHYKAYAREQSPNDQSAYAAAEDAAHNAGLGLWRDSSPVAPWDFRHARRTRRPPRRHPALASRRRSGHAVLTQGTLATGQVRQQGFGVVMAKLLKHVQGQ